MHADGFPPIESASAQVLILGSLPGQVSLQRREYYAQAQNCFWKLMGEILGLDLSLLYAERAQTLRERGIAVWDVCAAATRPGSLDAAIDSATVVPNDFRSFFQTHPDVKLVCFNGMTAERIYLDRVLPELPPAMQAIRRETLPSTSPANAAISYQEKLRRWSVIRLA